MTYQVEYTDTFGGEANYSWVKRSTVEGPEYDTKEPKGYQQTVMRRAKAKVGLTGVKGVTVRQGCGFEFRPYGMATVLFVEWIDS